MQFMKLQIEFGGDVNEVSDNLHSFHFDLFKFFIRRFKDHGSL